MVKIGAQYVPYTEDKIYNCQVVGYMRTLVLCPDPTLSWGTHSQEAFEDGGYFSKISDKSVTL